MKITIFLSLVLLFALNTKPLLGTKYTLPNRAIRDTLGKNVLAGTKYYIVPGSPDVGGLGLAGRGKAHCPLDVVVAVDGNRGLPVVFTPANTKKGVIRADMDVNIYFATETSCPGQSNVWKLGDFNSTTGEWFVTTGGVMGDPGNYDNIYNWFSIETYQGEEDVYELTYCPSVCSAHNCEHECSSIGIYEDQYGKRLGFNDFAYKVRFQPA
ncbi:miraculin-like [Lotus japonicus]|uniref:miraculin-like n=1 Tax=Lotus japonicus TaxID=34305 RepID=UPI00259013A7|nr:miraculin-like [Lotus japonicus]